MRPPILALLALPLLACSASVATGPSDCPDGSFFVEPGAPSARYAPRDELGTCQPERPAGSSCADSSWCAPGLECVADWHRCGAEGLQCPADATWCPGEPACVPGFHECAAT